MAVNILAATVDDAEAILDLQRRAYQTEAAIYDDYTLPPLLETLDEVRDQFRVKRFLKAIEDGRIVGSVRAVRTDAAYRIERLVVHPDCRNRGIATALMRQIEAAHPDATRFELFTGHKSVANLRLYERLGYCRVRQERVSDKVTLVFLEKPVQPPKA